MYLRKHWLLSLLVIPLAVNAKINVFGASSMTNALEDAKSEFIRQHPKVEINLSFASSSKLARQIENGAPANIFISANPQWINYLKNKNLLLTNSLAEVARNELVMIAPVNSKINRINLNNPKWIKLLGDGFLAVGDPDYVPAGHYAMDALSNLKTWDKLTNKLARTQNVRIALALVERGESPLGIVYASDAKLSSRVKIVAHFPPSSHQPIIYPIAIIKEQANAESSSFKKFLLSPAGQKIFAKYGFLPAQPTPQL